MNISKALFQHNSGGSKRKRNSQESGNNRTGSGDNRIPRNGDNRFPGEGDPPTKELRTKRNACHMPEQCKRTMA